MGANFLITTLDGKLDRKAVASKFREIQETDLYENGHSYGGGFGMAAGLEFARAYANDPSCFKTPDEAHEWLSQHCQKWEEAIAVRYTDMAGVQQWMIGAVCSS